MRKEKNHFVSLDAVDEESLDISERNERNVETANKVADLIALANKNFTKREYQVFAALTGINGVPLTITQTATRFKLSPARVSQIWKKIRTELQAAWVCERLK